MNAAFPWIPIICGEKTNDSPTPRPGGDMTDAAASSLPLSLPPRLLRGHQAAAFCGLTPRQFARAQRDVDEIGDPILPPPLRIAGQELWHVEQLRQRLDVLAGWSLAAIDDNEAERRVRQWRK